MKRYCEDCYQYIDDWVKSDELPTSNRKGYPLRLGYCSKLSMMVWSDDVICNEERIIQRIFITIDRAEKNLLRRL